MFVKGELCFGLGSPRGVLVGEQPLLLWWSKDSLWGLDWLPRCCYCWQGVCVCLCVCVCVYSDAQGD